jgi:hypothetical protein
MASTVACLRCQRIGQKPSQLHIEQLDAKLILDFLTHIEGERGNGAATRNLRLAAIKSFMRYVEYRVASALGFSVSKFGQYMKVW